MPNTPLFNHPLFTNMPRMLNKSFDSRFNFLERALVEIFM